MHRSVRFPLCVSMILSAAMWVATACGPAQPAQSPGGTEGTPTAGQAPSVTPTTAPTEATEGTPEPEPGNTALTAERIAGGIAPGDYQLEAYVIELRPCPECPPTISCKPCMGEFISVHDQASPPPSATTPMLRLKPEQIKQFEKGKRYRFELRAVSTPGGTNIDVVSATAIP